MIFPVIAHADIVPDTTLPENSRIDQQGDILRIEGGTQRNRNLFHSFQDFSIPAGGTAYFNNHAGIENVFARVTGSDRSEINGLIRANGEANLFLLNPRGILFGPNATLDVGGSFVATTANQIDFDGGLQFSALTPQPSALLSVRVPVGIQFGSNPQPIINQSSGLAVSQGETLALIGGRIDFQGGNIFSTGGRVELGAIGSSTPTQVGLSFTDNGLDFHYENVQNFQDIRFSELANISASNGSGNSIEIHGRTISLANASAVISETSGNTEGGGISIYASDSVILRDGAQIATFASGDGKAGDVFVRARNSVQILGTAPAQPGAANNRPSASGIGSQVVLPQNPQEDIAGQGGNVTIETSRLIARNGGGIEASTFATGNAGNIQITASDSIELSGANVFGSGVRDQILSGIFAQVAIGAIEDSGDAGQIRIRTRELTLLGGAQISSAARQGGRGGSVNVNATDSIRLSGQSPNATSTVGRSGIFVSAEESATEPAGQLNITTRDLIVEDNGEISANNFGPDLGGTITIESDRLIVRSGGDIRATSFGEGLAGDLSLSTSFIVLNGGQLTAETRSGERPNANIRLQGLDGLVMQNQSQISARAFNDASGGNISISAPDGFVVALVDENNDIIASASEGQGGNISINAQSIIGLEERRDTPANNTNDIDASSEFGAPGSVTINQPDVDPSRGLSELPSDLVDASNLVAQPCSTGSAVARERGEFTITGRSGLPPSPTAPRGTGLPPTEWATLEEESQIEQSTLELETLVQNPARAEELWNYENEIVEAQGWMVGEQGEIILVAEAPASPQVSTTNLNCNTALGN
ncbi:S-layer family protein [Cyanobacteria bacterium FACHB-471]|nr:S-layer family protein [Cyanobacteria bacterium FACHB-471]